MMNIKTLEERIQIIFKNHPKRLKHVMGVKETAVKLAIIHHEDTYRASIAALYHDIMKYHSVEDQIQYLSQIDIDRYQQTPVMYHALSAAEIARIEGIFDEDVLNAIRYHVWGRSGMSLLEKIIFVSDYCEPNRAFSDSRHIFEMAVLDLNQAVSYCMQLTIDEVQNKGLIPHPEQIAAFSYHKEDSHGKTKSDH